jgi:acetyl-CoA synthetase
VQAPEYFNFGYDVVDRWAQFDRNKLAMIWTNQQGDEKRYTFHELSQLSNQAANLLLKYGINPGDRVFLMLPRLPVWWFFSLALIKLNAVQCPSPTLLMPADLRHRINYGKFKMVITDLENAPKFDEVYEECPTLRNKMTIDGPRDGWIDYQHEISTMPRLSSHEVNTPVKVRTRSDSPMLIAFTSGTSKHPKAVLHNSVYPLAHRITAELWHGLSPNDLHFTVSDTGWAKNLWGNYFGQWIVGCCVFVFDVRGKFRAEELLPMLEKYEVTSFCAPPTVYRMLILNDLSRFDLKALRSCTAAGESLHTETVRVWKNGVGLTIREGYGQTETVCMIAATHGMKIKPGSMGEAMPGWEIELHDDDGREVPDGEEGRIAVNLKNRPVGLFDGYLYNDEENAKSFINGFYYTGDKAFRDDDGVYWFIGRADDIIKSSGYRIGPSEVEEVIMQHDAVHEVAVVGAPDPLRGARVKAYIVLNAGYPPTESLIKDIQQHVKHLTAPYKYPRDIEFVKKMPKTFSGKIKRDLLRRHAETGENGWDRED